MKDKKNIPVEGSRINNDRLKELITGKTKPLLSEHMSAKEKSNFLKKYNVYMFPSNK